MENYEYAKDRLSVIIREIEDIATNVDIIKSILLVKGVAEANALEYVYRLLDSAKNEVKAISDRI